MAPDSIAVSHITTAAVAVGLIQWLKHSKWFPWITQQRSRVMRIIALVTAGVGAVGIHYTWDPSARVLAFAVPTFGAILAAGVAYVKSFALQELAYQATKPTSFAELVKSVAEAIKGTAAAPAPAAAPEKV